MIKFKGGPRDIKYRRKLLEPLKAQGITFAIELDKFLDK